MAWNTSCDLTFKVKSQEVFMPVHCKVFAVYESTMILT